MKIVAISDTHLETPVLPKGDLLVHTGDLTYRGRPEELARVQHWFEKIEGDFRYGILFIAGNHDFGFQQQHELSRNILSAGTYLQDGGVWIGGFKFWGTPWVTPFYDWAFMDEDTPKGLGRYYDRIPDDTDVILCHGPAFGLLDYVPRGEHTGSQEMLRTLERVKPRLFIHGHIHDQYGEAQLGETRIFNVATCDDEYKPVHTPVVIDLA